MTRPEWPWPLAALALTLVTLAWSCRNAPLGVPVADDYTFLATLAFQHPLDWLGSMGSPLYWRPVSRQLYYLVLGPALVAHPFIAPLVHAALLAALFAVLYRIARRAWAPPVAATLAALPLAAEPVRVLLGWPSGGEYLLAALFAALAVHQGLRGRLLASTLAALLAVLSHEAGLLVLPVLPLVAWRRMRSPRHAMQWLGAVAAVGALWAAGFAASRAHGAALPPATGGPLLAAWWDVFGRTLRAQLLGEDATPWVRVAIASAALVWTVAVILEWRRANRSEPFRRGLVFGGLVWFVLGLVPAARVLPDWNAWRTFYPSLGLAFTAVGLAAAVAPRCVPLMLVVKLLSVALAPPAPARVDAQPPPTLSVLSFARLVRLQRTVASTRRALLERHPELPRGARVRYWTIPALTEYGFEGPRAPRVWYRDSTLSWQTFDGDPSHGGELDVLVEYDVPKAWPATVIEREAMQRFADGLFAVADERWTAADSLFAAATAAQPRVSGPFHSSLAHQRALLAVRSGALERADSLNAVDERLAGPSPRVEEVRARLAWARGDRAAADVALQRCLTLDPACAPCIDLAQAYGLLPPVRGR